MLTHNFPLSHLTGAGAAVTPGVTSGNAFALAIQQGGEQLSFAFAQPPSSQCRGTEGQLTPTMPKKSALPDHSGRRNVHADGCIAVEDKSGSKHRSSDLAMVPDSEDQSMAQLADQAMEQPLAAADAAAAQRHWLQAGSDARTRQLAPVLQKLRALAADDDSPASKDSLCSGRQGLDGRSTQSTPGSGSCKSPSSPAGKNLSANVMQPSGLGAVALLLDSQRGSNSPNKRKRPRSQAGCCIPEGDGGSGNRSQAQAASPGILGGGNNDMEGNDVDSLQAFGAPSQGLSPLCPEYLQLPGQRPDQDMGTQLDCLDHASLAQEAEDQPASRGDAEMAVGNEDIRAMVLQLAGNPTQINCSPFIRWTRAVRLLHRIATLLASAHGSLPQPENAEEGPSAGAATGAHQHDVSSSFLQELPGSHADADLAPQHEYSAQGCSPIEAAMLAQEDETLSNQQQHIAEAVEEVCCVMLEDLAQQLGTAQHQRVSAPLLGAWPDLAHSGQEHQIPGAATAVDDGLMPSQRQGPGLKRDRDPMTDGMKQSSSDDDGDWPKAKRFCRGQVNLLQGLPNPAAASSFLAADLTARDCDNAACLDRQLRLLPNQAPADPVAAPQTTSCDQDEAIQATAAELLQTQQEEVLVQPSAAPSLGTPVGTCSMSDVDVGGPEDLAVAVQHWAAPPAPHQQLTQVGIIDLMLVITPGCAKCSS